MMPPDQPSPRPVAATADLNQVFELVAPQVRALDEFMRAQVAEFEPEIREMAAYCLDTMGKRLRPTLVFASGWRDGAIQPDLVRVAGVVEMVHLATLVHDDIMDAAEIRRNRRTASREYGSDAAVLLGDALFAQALHVAAQFPSPEICRLVAASTRRVCSGEIMQTMRRRDVSISMGDYHRVIDLKTAELFRVSCHLGALVAGYPEDFILAAAAFGRHLGIAYQIYDDLVDFLGEESRIGKTLGTDLASGKLTLPLMLLLAKVSPAERESVVEALRGHGNLPLAASVERMRELGIAGDVVRAIEAELAAADQAIEAHRGAAPVTLLVKLKQVLLAQVAGLSVSHPPVPA
jgi:octaprenyl-diphosphate synthase